MNNYSWLEQKLHQFALSSQFMREVTFDFESKNISASSGTENHIFITGLARSGTTILLNALYKSNILDLSLMLICHTYSLLTFGLKYPLVRKI